MRTVVPRSSCPPRSARTRPASTSRPSSGAARRSAVRARAVAAVPRRRGRPSRSPGCCSAGSAPTSPPSPAARGATRRARADIVDGLRFQWARPFLRILLSGMSANLVINALFMAATVRLIQGGFPPGRSAWSRPRRGPADCWARWPPRGSSTAFATGGLTIVVAWSFVPLLLPLIFWNNPVVVMLSLSAGILLNPAGQRRHRLVPDVDHSARVGRAGPPWASSSAGRRFPLAPVLGGALLAALGGPRRDGGARRHVRTGRPDPNAEPCGALGAAAGGLGAPRDRAPAGAGPGVRVSRPARRRPG